MTALYRRLRARWHRLRRWWRVARCSHDWLVVADERALPPPSPDAGDVPVAQDGEPLMSSTRFGHAHGNVITGSGVPMTGLELVSSLAVGMTRFAAYFGNRSSVGMVCRRCHCVAIAERADTIEA